ncbi:MAG: MFS transporter [Solirubrobacterales bacterium]
MSSQPLSAPEVIAGAAERRRSGLRMVIALGIVSLLADMVYEGARSILGPFLVTLGASAATVGLVSGIGEFAGYSVRFFAGYATDRTREYWALTIGGYALTVISVPLIGLANGVTLALALVVGERLGKAIRSPAKDTILSFATAEMGRGYGFGLHEALDQTGAVIGPLLLAAILALHEGDYRLAFLSLAIPGVLTLAVLFWTRRRFPDPHELEHVQERQGDEAPTRSPSYRRYLAFTSLAVLGFAPFPLIGYHLVTQNVVADSTVPLIFAFAMAVDALMALVAGRIYDRRGLLVLLVVPLATVGVLLAFTQSPLLVWAGAGIWGSVIGLQESTLRAAVGDMIPGHGRGMAYGVFNGLYGFALLAGAAAMGALYGVSVGWLVAFVAAIELLAAVAFLPLVRSLGARAAS